MVCLLVGLDGLVVLVSRVDRDGLVVLVSRGVSSY